MGMWSVAWTMIYDQRSATTYEIKWGSPEFDVYRIMRLIFTCYSKHVDVRYL